MVGAAVAALLLLLLAAGPRAQASELLYWDNFEPVPATLGVANIDGSWGRAVNVAGVEINDPEGMAYDSVGNRIYIASSSGGPSGDGEIVFVNLDGTGAGIFTPPAAAQVDEPTGIAVDPVGRTVYWTNSSAPDPATGSLAWARLDGSAGGLINTAGATLDEPYRLGLDVVNRKVYWINKGVEPHAISFANLDGSGGGNLNLAGATPTDTMRGPVVDPDGNRIYWLAGDRDGISFAALDGTGGGDLVLADAPFHSPYSLAMDPSLGRLYWANYGVAESRTNAIGFLNLAGGSGGITPLTGPVDGPQDVVVIKSPAPTAPPVIARGAGALSSHLSCSPGGWGGDFPGSFVYRAPRSFAYQWTTAFGAPIPGATGPTYVASARGTYGCTVTASNQAGSTAQGSARVLVSSVPRVRREFTRIPRTITPASLQLVATKRKARTRIGKLATYRVQVFNRGHRPARGVRVCVKVPKQLRKFLRPRKCRKVGKLPGGIRWRGKLKVKVKRKARDRNKRGYKLRLVVRGQRAKPVKAHLKVVGR